MATKIPVRPRRVARASHSYAVVESLYNRQFVEPMADAATREIQEIEPSASIDRVHSPGAFEIPLISKTLLEGGKYHALLALGVILNGETPHADLIARAVTDSLMRLSLEYGVPVIHEVLLLQNEEQARVRCLGQDLNRGLEAARAAVKSVQILEEVVSSCSH